MAGPIRKLLVPVDLSACSARALERAVELSRACFGSAPIDVLHVWQPPAYVDRHPAAAGLAEAARVQAQKELEALAARVHAPGGPEPRILHEVGDPARAIVEAATRAGYDLIVMGTHGRGGAADDALGSVAEKVVRRAPCPVLTVRSR